MTRPAIDDVDAGRLAPTGGRASADNVRSTTRTYKFYLRREEAGRLRKRGARTAASSVKFNVRVAGARGVTPPPHHSFLELLQNFQNNCASPRSGRARDGRPPRDPPPPNGGSSSGTAHKLGDPIYISNARSRSYYIFSSYERLALHYCAAPRRDIMRRAARKGIVHYDLYGRAADEIGTKCPALVHREGACSSTRITPGQKDLQSLRKTEKALLGCLCSADVKNGQKNSGKSAGESRTRPVFAHSRRRGRCNEIRSLRCAIFCVVYDKAASTSLIRATSGGEGWQEDELKRGDGPTGEGAAGAPTLSACDSATLEPTALPGRPAHPAPGQSHLDTPPMQNLIRLTPTPARSSLFPQPERRRQFPGAGMTSLSEDKRQPYSGFPRVGRRPKVSDIDYRSPSSLLPPYYLEASISVRSSGLYSRAIPVHSVILISPMLSKWRCTPTVAPRAAAGAPAGAAGAEGRDEARGRPPPRRS
ncbi:hypothetical protein EVAR_83222_1 [Eumeta japonica]|uniref:Uncharacterized protein n=1 Tax=Eumeta variegata TaxID=151549 RepID=A0A4C1Y4I9_EUMVA|nr:hypothetical protein EVAR_83222_1 [Eumeta japonica]